LGSSEDLKTSESLFIDDDPYWGHKWENWLGKIVSAVVKSGTPKIVYDPLPQIFNRGRRLSLSIDSSKMDDIRYLKNKNTY
jgi:hypothetical protein